jgi:hypothetical protein
MGLDGVCGMDTPKYLAKCINASAVGTHIGASRLGGGVALLGLRSALLGPGLRFYCRICALGETPRWPGRHLARLVITVRTAGHGQLKELP